MSDPHLNAVPLASSSGIPDDAPAIPLAVEPAALSRDPVRPLVESLETFLPRLERVAGIPTRGAEVARTRATLPRSVSHRQFQRPLDVSQGSRGSCWAFAGIA